MLSRKRLARLSIWTMLLSLFMSSTAFADTINQSGNITNNIVFIDVKANYWANEAITSMAGKGIISGTGDGTFQPEAPVTREQLAKLITLTFGLDPITPSTPTFSDVNSSSWAYGFVEASKDFLTGYFPLRGKPFFDPKANATREDVAVALVRAMDLQATGSPSSNALKGKFKDYEQISPQLMGEVALAVDNKLIQGFTDGTFRPQAQIDRGSVAALLYRVLKSSYSSATQDVELSVTVPEKVSTDSVTFSGKVTPGAELTINDQEIEYTKGSFKTTYKLTDGEGDYDFEIIAKLPNGRTTTVYKTVTYTTNGPKLTVNAPESATEPSVKINGRVTDTSDSYPKVTVNGESVNVYSGEWSTQLTLKEGKNTVTVVATNKFDKETTVEKEITLTLGGPQLTIDNVPETSSSATIRLTGRAKDKNDSYPKIYMNDELVGNYGEFSELVTLKEGPNVFRFKATNSLGKSSTVITKTIIFEVGGPELILDNVPEISTSATVRLTGRAKDKNDNYPKVYMNDELVSNYYGEFSETVTLKEGPNIFRFKATNNLGKSSVVITKTITFEVGGPELILDNVPETSSSATVRLTGRAKDKNDNYPKVYMNDELISNYYGEFSETVTLKEGLNTFRFKATNSLGKSSIVITKVITYKPGLPELTLDYIPDITKAAEITLSGTVKDANDYNPKVYLNDQLISSYGSTFSTRVTLKEGENTFVFKVSNNAGKLLTVEKKVIYTPDRG